MTYSASHRAYCPPTSPVWARKSRASSPPAPTSIHFDVMDNHYVPNLTIGPLVCEAIRPLTKAPIDVHLMVKPVDRIMPDFAKAGANIISFHPEASEHIDRTIGLIKEHGCKAGLVFNPATPLRLSRSRARQARPGADHVGQPGFRRPEVHSRGAGQAARGAQQDRRSGPRHLAGGRRRRQDRQHRRDRARRRRHLRRRLGDLRRQGLQGDHQRRCAPSCAQCRRHAAQYPPTSGTLMQKRFRCASRP